MGATLLGEDSENTGADLKRFAVVGSMTGQEIGAVRDASVGVIIIQIEDGESSGACCHVCLSSRKFLWEPDNDERTDYH